MAVEVINTGGGESGGGGGGNVVLGIVVGAVLLAVAVGALFMWDNFKSGGGTTLPAAVHVTVQHQ